MNNQKPFRYNLCAKGREYTVGDKRKNTWLPIGTATIWAEHEPPVDLSISVELNHMPNQKISAFPQKKDEF